MKSPYNLSTKCIQSKNNTFISMYLLHDYSSLLSSTKPSSLQHSKAAFVIGQGATLKYDQFGIVRWNPETGDEFLIGCFPFRPNAYLATLEGRFVFSYFVSLFMNWNC